MKRQIIAVALAASLAGCSAAQVVSYTAALNATSNVLKEIGHDLVAIDCASAGLIQVIAKDAGAAQRVQNVIDRNAKIAIDACPALTGKPAVQVVAGG